MSKKDYRVVEMTFENKQFEKNVNQSIKTLSNLEEALKMKGATDGIEKVEKVVGTMDFSPITEGIESVVAKATIAGNVVSSTMLGAFSKIKAGFDRLYANTIGQIKSGGSARAINIANAQFKLEGLGIDWKKASDDINQAVDGTAYSFDAAANTASQLATAGIKLGDAYGGMAHSLKAVSGIAAMTNSSYEEIGYIFSQIASAGRLMGQDAMQISTRGINVTATLAKQLNKTTDEIQEMQRKGEISFAMFAEAMNDAFGDQAAKANETFQGAMSNVKSALSRIGEIFYGPFYNAMIKPLNTVRERINDIKKAFSDGDDATRDFKDRLTDVLNIASRLFTYFVENINLKGINTLADSLNRILDILIDIGTAWEKTIGIFDSKDAVSENKKLEASLKSLTDAELDAAKAIWETGKYGNGQNRIDALKAAGFDEESISRIQSAIDKFIASNYQWADAEKTVSEETKNANEEFDMQKHNVMSSWVHVIRDGTATLKNLGSSVINVARAFGNIGVAAVDSFFRIFKFDDVTKWTLKVSESIKSFTESLVDMTRGNLKVKKTFDSIFNVGNNLKRIIVSIFGIMVDAVTSFATVVGSSFDGFKTGTLNVGSFTDKVAKLTENLRKIISRLNIFEKAFSKIIGWIKNGIAIVKTVPGIVTPVIDRVINSLSKLLDKFKSITGIDIKSKLKKISDAFKNFFDAIKDPFSKDEEGITNISKWADGIKSALLGVFDKPSEVFEKIKEWFSKGIGEVKNNPKMLIPEGLFKSLGKALSGLFSVLTSLDYGSIIGYLKKVAGLAAVISGIVLALNLNKLVKTIQSPVEKLKEIVTSVVDVFNTIKTVTTDVGKAIVMDLKADAFIKIAIGITALATTLIGLGLMDTATLAKGMTALSVCVVSLATAVAMFNKTAGSGNNKLAVLNTSFIQFGAALAIMGGLTKMFGKMDYETLIKGLLSLITITTLFTSVEMMLSKMPSRKSNTYMGLIGTALAVDIMIPFLTKIGKMKWWDAFKALGSLTVVITEFSVVTMAMSVLSKNFDATGVLKFSASMAIISASMDILIPMLMTMSAMNFGGFMQSIAGFSVVIGEFTGMFAVMALIGNRTKLTDLLASASAFVIMSLCLAAIVPTLAAIRLMAYTDERSLLVAAGVLAGLSVVVLAVSHLISGDVGINEVLKKAEGIATILSMSLMFAGLAALTKSVVSLSNVPSDKIWNAVAVVAALGGVITAIISILAVVNTSTAEGVLVVAASFAAVVWSISLSFSAASLALGTASILFGKGIDGIAKGIDRFSKIKGERFLDSMRNIVKGISILAEGLIEVAPTIGNAIGQILTSIVVKVLEKLPDIINDLNVIARVIVGNVFENAFQGIAAGIVSLLNAVATILTALLDGGKDSLAARLVELAINLFLLVIDKLTERSYEIISALGDLVIAIMDGVGTYLLDNNEALVNAWVKMQLGLSAVVDEALKWAKLVGVKLAESLISGIKSKANDTYKDINEWGNERIKDFKRVFGISDSDGFSAKLFKIGKGLILGFLNGLIAEQNRMYKAGTEFLTDFLDGIDYAWTDVQNSIYRKAGELVSLWKLGLGEHSPSKKTYESAVNLLLGCTNGLKDKATNTKLGKSIKDITSEIVEKFKDGLGFNSDSDGFLTNLFGDGGLDLNSLLDSINNNEFSITPVIDTTTFDSQMNDLASSFNSNDYSLGLATSTNLASGINPYQGYNNQVVSGSNVDLTDITNEIKSMSDKISRLEVRMDTGALVGALYAGIDEKLGEKQILAGRGVYA